MFFVPRPPYCSLVQKSVYCNYSPAPLSGNPNLDPNPPSSLSPPGYEGTSCYIVLFRGSLEGTRLPATNMCSSVCVHIASYMRQTLCHSLVLGNDETFVIECETWQVNVVMATVNLDYVALSSALPACVCVYRERERRSYLMVPQN